MERQILSELSFGSLESTERRHRSPRCAIVTSVCRNLALSLSHLVALDTGIIPLCQQLEMSTMVSQK